MPFIRANRFIDALCAAGLLPDNVASVTIDARIGEPVRMSYDVLPDEALLGTISAIELTNRPDSIVLPTQPVEPGKIRGTAVPPDQPNPPWPHRTRTAKDNARDTWRP
jgi:hypothetical protein